MYIRFLEMQDHMKTQNRSDRKKLKLLAKSRYFRKLVRKGLREIKERKVNPWKDVWDKL
jgi:hypothetical protein